MNRFVRLTHALECAADDDEKCSALFEYFSSAAPSDAAWALFFLLGRRTGRCLSGPELRELALEASGLPEWLVDESIEATGDLAEAAAHLVECGLGNAECGINPGKNTSLAEVIEIWVTPLREAGEDQRRAMVLRAWSALDSPARFLFNRLALGELRLAAPRPLLVRALAQVAHLDQAEMAQRMEDPFEPTAAAFECLTARDRAPCSPGPAYPFQLAAPLAAPPESLGAFASWQAEWHYEGVRAQFIRRRGVVMIWSRHEQLLTAQCPELGGPGCGIPDGTVLDGVLAGWRAEGPLPPERLRQRLARKNIDKKLLADAPIVFIAFDLLEAAGCDLRHEPLDERRRRLEELYKKLETGGGGLEKSAIRLAPALEAEDWNGLKDLRTRARGEGMRGVILKRREAPYREGRAGSDWFKWPAAPHLIKAVMLYAERAGAGLHTNLTLGAWEDGALAAIAQAEADLENGWDEIESFIRQNTLEKHGPVRMVKPELVFEVAFEGVESAPRRKSGLLLRGARVAAWANETPPHQVATLDELRKMIR